MEKGLLTFSDNNIIEKVRFDFISYLIRFIDLDYSKD